jgi:uncharacterized protein YjbI with pentapeptide repeats
MSGKQQANQRKRPVLSKEPRVKGIAGGRLEDSGLYRSISATRERLTDQEAGLLTIEDALFVRVEFDGTRLRGPQLSDIRFDNCNFANARWDSPIAHRIELIGCKLTGFSAFEGHFQDILIQGCKGDLAAFRFAKFRAARFENCLLTEADFGGTDLSGSVFVNCDLRNAQMSGAVLDGVDLRGSNIEGMRVGAKELRGAIVDPVQAVELARILGIVVKWTNETGT